jgi:hypothetical protein
VADIESPYNRVVEEPVKDTVSIPEWAVKLLLPTKRVSVPCKKELFRIVQPRIDRAVLELESALEVLRQENK